ncbi:MAG: hypothetical protein B6V02_01725 [Thermoprotei archaeon ex4572_64]|nr:MAG: hypothetical protein B6V02_01725 [Thermoprotei archaeon ex4572_64]
MSSVILSNLKTSKSVKGEFVDIVVFTTSNGVKYIQGVIKCPYTNKEFNFKVTPHDDQARLGFIQHDGGFLEHCRKVEKYREWFVERAESYSRNSFHKRKLYICSKCGFKTTRYIDMLIHLMNVHGFLVNKS